MPVEKHILAFKTASGSLIELPIIKPSAWIRCLAKQDMTLLSGGDADYQKQFWSFWKCFQFTQPGHEIFRSGSDEVLKKTVPLIIFGDEGRYLKKGNFMVATIECPLGSTPTKLKECTCRTDPGLQRYELGDVGHDPSMQAAVRTASLQFGNHCGHSFLSKFLCFGLKSQIYKKHPDLLEQAFNLVSQDLQDLHSHGVIVEGQTLFATTVGIKGDLKFHHQLGHLERSYYNLGVTKEHPICTFCHAGAPGVPFEDLEPDAAWRSTMFMTRPWQENAPPNLSKIPGDRSAPENSFKLDTFHCWKLGVGRDVIGSLIISFCLLGYFDFGKEDFTRNIDDRLDRAWSHFSLYCSAEGKTPAVHYFSKMYFNITNFRQFPWSNSKGSDTTLLTLWLTFFIKPQRQSGTVQAGHETFMDLALETLEAATTFFEILYGHRLWLQRPCAQRCLHCLRIMLRGFKLLARESKCLGLVAFSLKAKFHALDHISRDLADQLSGLAPLILSPLAFACEGNEDMVGRTSRVARRLSSRLVSLRVLERVTLKMRLLTRKRRRR